MYFAVTTKKYYIILMPIVVEIIIEGLKYNGIFMEKYIATKYLYNDYLRELNKKDSIYSSFSEANYDKIIGLDTTDLSQQNIKNILEWSKEFYNKSYLEKNELLTDLNGKEHDALELKKITDNNKFKLICEKCDIKQGMRILEIGFGEGDFMKYIYENYGIKPIGLSISSEQIKLIKQMGFDAYELDFWDMTPENIGKYDLIIQCGNNEYIRCVGESFEKKYTDFCKVIKSVLNENGKYFVTCIHETDNFKFSFYDNVKAYILWSGNDGSYPKSRNGFSKYAEMIGLKTIYQENRIIDYWITYVIWASHYRCRKNKTCLYTVNIQDTLYAFFKTIADPYYIHTYLCYTPNDNYYWLPWLWQFVPQERNGKLEFPVTLEYILFQNEN